MGDAISNASRDSCCKGLVIFLQYLLSGGFAVLKFQPLSVH